MKHFFNIIIFAIAAVGTWTGYWSLALRLEGFLVIEEIVSVTDSSKMRDGEPMVLVKIVGRTTRSPDPDIYEAVMHKKNAPKVGATWKIYVGDNPLLVRTNDRLPGGGRYVWLSTVLWFVTAALVLCARVVYSRVKPPRTRVTLLALITVLVIVVGYFNPMERVWQIREHVRLDRWSPYPS